MNRPISKAETNRIEYKQQLTDDLEKEAVAFLNYKEGGAIYIGIDKTGKAIVNYSKSEDFVKSLRNCLHISLNNRNTIKRSCCSDTFGARAAACCTI